MASNVPAFNIGLPLGQPAGVYPPATPTQGVPGMYVPPQVPGTPDQYTGSAGSVSQLANPVGVGALAGYKAPRGLEHVRQLLHINKFGQRSFSGGSRGGRYGGYSSYGNRSGYYNYSRGGRNSMRSYGGRGGSRVGSSGAAASFGLWAAVKSSVIWGGVLSLATNGWSLYKKQETGAQAGANVVGDVASSAVGGAAGAVASYMGCGMLAAMGMGGIALSLCGIGLGIGGFFVADQLLRRTQIFQSIQSGVYSMLGGK